MGSLTTRHRSVTTRLRRRRHGTAPSSGLISTLEVHPESRESIASKRADLDQNVICSPMPKRMSDLWAGGAVSWLRCYYKKCGCLEPFVMQLPVSMNGR